VSRDVRWRAIATELAGQIDSGKLAVGSRLPTEAALAERFGVHRLTARQAMVELRRSGRVETRQGRGSVVRAVSRPFDSSVDPVTMRHPVTGAAANGAVEKIMTRSVVADRHSARQLGLATERVARITTVTSIAGEAVVTSLYHLHPDLRDLADDGDVMTALASNRPAHRYGWHVVSAEISTSEDEAALDVVAGSTAMLVREGLVLDGDVPLCHVVRRCRADRIAFLSRYHGDTSEATI
jgi:DNA-binding GntR family transcriptional regulator